MNDHKIIKIKDNIHIVYKVFLYMNRLLIGQK